MECRQCGRNIAKGKPRLILAILDDPQFCSADCEVKWMNENNDIVSDYLIDVFTTKTSEE